MVHQYIPIMTPLVSVILPIKTVNELNKHDVWQVRNARARDQHGTTLRVLQAHAKRKPVFPVVVTCKRLAPSQGLDAHDGLPAALKFVVDGVAHFLGCDDAETDKVTWKYEQARANNYSVEVHIDDSK